MRLYCAGDIGGIAPALEVKEIEREYLDMGMHRMQSFYFKRTLETAVEHIRRSNGRKQSKGSREDD